MNNRNNNKDKNPVKGLIKYQYLASPESILKESREVLKPETINRTHKPERDGFL
jgi:DNA-directed RNA polymerase beta' subunit